MKTSLVTGGAGFLGAHLCRELLKKGHKVICIDDLSTGNINNIPNRIKNFQFFLHDICSPFEASEHIEEIYNLACPASPLNYQGKNAIQTTKTCVLGALNILELAKVHGATVLQASTSEVYGEPLVSPQRETDRGNVNPIGIRACYDEGKRCAESLFFDFFREEGIKVKVVRLFNTYGPMMSINDGRVVPNFICQALRGDNITVYGDGSQTRSFCFVHDTISGIVRMMESDSHITGPVNIGNPEEITILELAKTIIEKVRSSSKIVFRPIPDDDPTRRVPDIGKASALLGFKPTTSLDEGLELTIPYYINLLGGVL
ncbi:UDP-glucuronic acid decarboxylase family protein [Bilophila wadsworthia]|uniref:UDP-glucuronic acid decarboxylase family protein n=1 Tax=Bilophila wadsworthia TaxID=35833 RepID=UPI002673D033|nr:UDP-glucuronic acid decarboxylase family protein [Bilophila wadsworthia]